jgi:hypothetical protein
MVTKPKRKAPAKRKPAKPRKPAKGAVEKAVDRDLKALGRIESHALAASARALARELDNATNSAHSKSLCARALQEQLERLREMAPPKKTKDKLDELSSRRDARLARRAAS